MIGRVKYAKRTVRNAIYVYIVVSQYCIISLESQMLFTFSVTICSDRCSFGYCHNRNSTSPIYGNISILEETCAINDSCEVFDFNSNLSVGHLCFSHEYFHVNNNSNMVCRTKQGKPRVLGFMFFNFQNIMLFSVEKLRINFFFFN